MIMRAALEKFAESVKTDVLAPGAEFRHYKGGLYAVVVVAKLEATQEDHVVYKSLVTGAVWIRPLIEFMGQVEHEGRSVARFERARD